jgi:cation:H+ antiporter
VHHRLLRWEIPVLAAATVAVMLVAANGHIQRAEGAVMFAGLLAFIVISPRLWPEPAAASEGETAEATAALPRDARGRALQGGVLLLGLAGLTIGAEIAVGGAVGIAERAEISELAIGATIVATGTSLPEVATSVVAAFRREHEIAVANVIGSNIFNLLGVLGLTAGLFSLEVRQDLYQFEMLALALSTAILLPLVWPRYRIGRLEGGALLVLYVLFVITVLIRA